MSISVKPNFDIRSFYFNIPSTLPNMVFDAAEYCADVIGKSSGINAVAVRTDVAADCANGILAVNLVYVNSLEKILPDYVPYINALDGSDGYAVVTVGKKIYLAFSSEGGAVQAVYGFTQDNFPVVWGRGAKDLQVDYNVCKFESVRTDYVKKSPFAIRAYNMCGVGSTGEGHVDEGSAAYYAKNGMNGISHYLAPEWKKYGLIGVGINIGKANNIDDLANVFPEYFMTDFDGKPKLSTEESFVNYYNAQAARVMAERLVAYLNANDPETLYGLIMPDNPYFYMTENGVKLHELPFVTDDGNTVYPQDENYKSTVYFNYMNRVIREVNRLRPNTYLYTFAYLYSEKTPAVKIDEHLIVSLAPIHTNERYSYVAMGKHTGNAHVARNIESWSRVCKKLCIYTYWNSFQGSIYTRPILKQVKENLKWFKSLGVYGLVVEGKVDCSLVENMSDAQKGTRKFFDLNEACTYVINSLMMDPEQEIDNILRRFAEIVYKEVSKEFLEYYALIEKGFDSKDAYVWYPTGGDVYVLQFIVEAGIKDDVLKVLSCAREKAVTPSVKTRIESLCQTVFAQIDRYADFVRENGSVTKVDVAKEEILSERSLDYKNNAFSVWNKAAPMKVLRNYSTMEFYPKEADFECRMLFDGKTLYVGYSVNDARIKSTETAPDGNIRVKLKDGNYLTSYAETYIGGNELNKSVYYGYISGFRQSAAQRDFYMNDGVLHNQKDKKGITDALYAHLSENVKERYVFHVQAIPLEALGVTEEDFSPYGSFVYYNDGYGRAGWMGFGLWSKQNFQSLKIRSDTI